MKPSKTAFLKKIIFHFNKSIYYALYFHQDAFHSNIFNLHSWLWWSHTPPCTASKAHVPLFPVALLSLIPFLNPRQLSVLSRLELSIWKNITCSVNPCSYSPALPCTHFGPVLENEYKVSKLPFLCELYFSTWLIWIAI